MSKSKLIVLGYSTFGSRDEAISYISGLMQLKGSIDTINSPRAFWALVSCLRHSNGFKAVLNKEAENIILNINRFIIANPDPRVTTSYTNGTAFYFNPIAAIKFIPETKKHWHPSLDLIENYKIKHGIE